MSFLGEHCVACLRSDVRSNRCRCEWTDGIFRTGVEEVVFYADKHRHDSAGPLTDSAETYVRACFAGKEPRAECHGKLFLDPTRIENASEETAGLCRRLDPRGADGIRSFRPSPEPEVHFERRSSFERIILRRHDSAEHNDRSDDSERFEYGLHC